MSGLFFSDGSLGWDVSPPETDTPEDGFDTVTLKKVVQAATESQARANYPKGSLITGWPNIYVMTVKARELFCGAGYFELDIVGRGLADQTKPYKVRWLTIPERNSYKNVTVTGFVTNGAADIQEPRVGINVKWISVGRPDMSALGTHNNNLLELTLAGVPIPDLPAFRWVIIGDSVRNVPDYWSLDSRNPELLTGTNIWLVDDVISFYYPVKPAK